MRSAIVVVMLLALGLGSGCKRGVCTVGDAEFDPMSEKWEAHRDLVPPSATVCGHFKAKPGVSDMSRTLQIDFEDDPNPWVTIVDYLEKKGLTRTSQSIDNPNTQRVSFSRDGKALVNITTIRNKRRVRAVMTLVGE